MKIRFIITVIVTLELLTSCGTHLNSTIDNNVSMNEYNTINELNSVLETTVISIGGPSYCPHSLKSNGIDIEDSYHEISGTLIQYIGEEKSNEWFTRYNNNFEMYNIEQFVNDFDIPRDIFEFLYFYDGVTKYNIDYNIEAIYNKKCDEYYNENNFDERYSLFNINYYTSCLKSNLLDYIKQNQADHFSAWVEKLNKTGEWCHASVPDGLPEGFMVFTGQIGRWNISEFIDEFQISDNILRQLESRFSKNANTGCELDYSRLYNDISSGLLYEDSVYITFNINNKIKSENDIANITPEAELGYAEPAPAAPDMP